MAGSEPTLAFVQLPEALREQVVASFEQIWRGPRVISTVAGARSHRPSLAVVAGRNAPEAWRTAAELARRVPKVPIFAVVAGASRLRRSRAVPREVCWAASPDELEGRLLEMTVRFVLTTQDKRSVEQELRQLRLADVGWLMGHVSHEIGNPLTTLLTNLEVIQRQLADAVNGRSEVDLPDVLEAVRDAYSGASHVSRIASDLRRASRPTSRASVLDVVEVVDTARRLASKPLHGVAVRVHRQQVPPVRVDETRLCQVFLNLLKNAARALQGTPGPKVDLWIVRRDDQVVVTVANNGPPIPQADLPNLFRQGFTTDRDGSGIGLPLSRRYVLDMGGTLELVEHEPHVAFEVRLPTAQRAPVRDTLVPTRIHRSARILVVDDAAGVRRAMGRALGRDHRVELAGTVDEALMALARSTFDLVITDLQLPRRTGLDLHRAILQGAEPRPRVVVLSGRFGDEDMAWIEAHQLPWARKPVGAEVLRDLVSELLRTPTTMASSS